ncbi:hypothetical protein QFZ84_005409, partial [Pseudomonas fluorescens]
PAISEPAVFLRRTIHRAQGFADQFIHFFTRGKNEGKPR